MDATELNEIQREIGALMHDVLVHLTQMDGRPISGPTLRRLREFGLKCYLQGMGELQRMPTLPAPPESEP